MELAAGRWAPLDNALVADLPTDRPYTRLEAMFSLTVDATTAGVKSMRAYARIWRWDPRRVRRLFGALRRAEGSTGDGTGQRAKRRPGRRARARGSIRFMGDISELGGEPCAPAGPSMDQSGAGDGTATLKNREKNSLQRDEPPPEPPREAEPGGQLSLPGVPGALPTGDPALRGEPLTPLPDGFPTFTQRLELGVHFKTVHPYYDRAARRRVLEKFRNVALSRGWTRADWVAAFKLFAESEAELDGHRPGRGWTRGARRRARGRGR